MTLNQAQQAHISKIFPECKDQMAKYLSLGVDVIVYRQFECGSDVPPFAVAPVDNHGFWIGCWDTQEQATKEAEKLGLKVVPL